MLEQFTPTTPIGYINKAEAYRAGAQLLARDLQGVGGWAGDPTRYLYYHCIELYLKAALISTGLTDRELRNIGHGFVTLANRANMAGLGLVEPDHLTTLDLIDGQDNYIKARYHKTGAFSVATIQALDWAAHEIAWLTVNMVRKTAGVVHDPRAALPEEYRFQSS